MLKIFFLNFFFLLYLLNTIITIVHAESIKNITHITNIKETHLIGYSLVIGLNGTGDYNEQNHYNLKSLNNILSKLNINNITEKNIKIKNIASVLVTAKLPKFYKNGDKINVIVASISNAKNINNGILLMTALKDNKNNIYAIAQGKINSFNNKNKKIIKKETNIGYIYNGGIIENIKKKKINKQTIINLKLNEENFTLCKRISDTINIYYPNTAFSINSNTIQLKINKKNIMKVKIMSNIENIDIPIYNKKSKIIINKKNGIILIKGNIKIDECTILNKNLFLKIKKNNIFNSNKKIFLNYKQKNYINKKIPNNVKIIYTNQNLDFIINKLYNYGFKTSELISILKIIKKSNCLKSILEII